MVKRDLVEIVAQKAHLTKRGAQEAINTFVDEIEKALVRGETVLLSGFGTFRIDTKSDKDVVVIGSNKRMTVGSHHVVRFIPGKPLRRAVW